MIGNGQETRALTEPWIPRTPSFLPIAQRATDMRVSEFIQQPSKCDEERINQHFLPPDAQLIQTIPLSLYNHSDFWLWHYTRNGSYTVKSGYNLATSIDSSEASSSSDVLAAWWKEFWEIKLPRKVLMFGWRGFHEILPTGKGLLRRNILIHSNCPLCGFGEDSNAQAVFWCPFAQELWALFEFQFMIGQKEDISFRGVLFYATELLDRDSLTKLFIAAWSLWHERNRRNHKQQPRPLWQLKGWICSYYEETKKAILMEGKAPRGGPSATMNEAGTGINNFSLLVDAAISEQNNMIGLGAVMFTPTKRIQATLSKPLRGVLSVLNAEALTLVVGLQWALSVGIPIKKISSDSLCLVTALKNANAYYNELGILISDIQALLTNFPEATISHINRKYNVVAHNLAKRALQLNEEQSWINGTPHPDDTNI